MSNIIFLDQCSLKEGHIFLSIELMVEEPGLTLCRVSMLTDKDMRFIYLAKMDCNQKLLPFLSVVLIDDIKEEIKQQAILYADDHISENNIQKLVRSIFSIVRLKIERYQANFKILEL